jgi:cell division protein FtsL
MKTKPKATMRRKQKETDTRTLRQKLDSWFKSDVNPLPIQAIWAACNKLVVVNICLLMLTVFSALAVVYSKHTTRQLNTRLQQLANQRDTLQAEWTQLMLEQGTWATNARVEEIAIKHLNMISPDPQAMQPLVDSRR